MTVEDALRLRYGKCSVFSGQCSVFGMVWISGRRGGLQCSVVSIQWSVFAMVWISGGRGWIAVTQRYTEKKEIHGENLLIGVGLVGKRRG